MAGPKKFTNPPLDLISHNCTTNLATDGQTETRLICTAWRNDKEKMRCVNFSPHLTNSAKIRRAPDTQGLRKNWCLQAWIQNSQLLGGNGNGKKFTAFGTTSFEHCLAVFGLHARTKTMGAFTTNFAGLISSFGHSLRLLRKIYSQDTVKDVLLTILVKICQEKNNYGLPERWSRNQKRPCQKQPPSDNLRYGLTSSKIAFSSTASGSQSRYPQLFIILLIITLVTVPPLKCKLIYESALARNNFFPRKIHESPALCNVDQADPFCIAGKRNGVPWSPQPLCFGLGERSLFTIDSKNNEWFR